MAETMSAILKEEPKDLSESNPNVSPALNRTVRRCLEKKAERRFQSTSDLGFALESLTAASTSSSTMADIAVNPIPARTNPRWLLYGCLARRLGKDRHSNYRASTRNAGFTDDGNYSCVIISRTRRCVSSDHRGTIWLA